MYLRNVPVYSRSFALLQSTLERVGLHPVIESTISCPALAIRGHETEVKELINKYSLRRKVAALDRRGVVTFHPESSHAQIEEHLERFFDQHVARWAGTASPSQFVRPEQRLFYRQLVRSLADTDVLCFSRLELDGIPVAYHFGFRRGKTLIWYKPTFDPALADFSPGLVLIRKLIEHAIATGCDELDFTIGDEPFKERFTNRRRANANVRVFGSTTSYLLGLVAQRLRHVRRTILRLLRRKRRN
jgi:CelD/BcsL family acetyltransferase involved in cellulose biosynthesis